VPHFRFDRQASYRKVNEFYYMNASSDYDYKELYPEDLFGLFSVEKGGPGRKSAVPVPGHRRE
jgi:hypothetical protein